MTAATWIQLFQLIMTAVLVGFIWFELRTITRHLEHMERSSRLGLYDDFFKHHMRYVSEIPLQYPSLANIFIDPSNIKDNKEEMDEETRLYSYLHYIIDTYEHLYIKLHDEWGVKNSKNAKQWEEFDRVLRNIFRYKRIREYWDERWSTRESIVINSGFIDHVNNFLRQYYGDSSKQNPI